MTASFTVDEAVTRSIMLCLQCKPALGTVTTSTWKLRQVENRSSKELAKKE